MPDIFVAAPKEKEAAPKKLADFPLPEVLDEKKEEQSAPIKPYTSPSRRVHILSSFCENPRDLKFRSQEKDEKILLFIRKALITNLKWFVMGIALLCLPLFLTAFIDFAHFFLPLRYVVLFAIFYYLLVASYIYVNFITWYFNVAIVTNTRVIDIDFSNLIYKNVAATKMSLVQDIDFVQVGVARTFFNYGDILVQTAGAMDNFEFTASPHPEKAVHIIENLIGEKK